EELGALYRAYSRGDASGLREPEWQYGDYACWQRQWLEGEVYERQMAYWRQQLAGMATELRLPSDRQRPVEPHSAGRVERRRLSAELSQGLRQLSRREGASLYMVLLAGFEALLYRHSGESDMVVGSPIAGRSRQEWEGLIGFFVNTLVLRVAVEGGASFRELLGRVREVTLGAYGHQDMPFEKLVEELAPARSLSRTPLFQVMFVLQNLPMQAVELSHLRISPKKTDNSTSKFDLTLSLSPEDDGLMGWWEYNIDMFDASTVRRTSEQYERLLEEVLKNPDVRSSQMVLLTNAVRAQLLVTWNDTKTDYPGNQSVQDLFEAQAAKTPDRTAVRFKQ